MFGSLCPRSLCVVRWQAIIPVGGLCTSATTQYMREIYYILKLSTIEIISTVRSFLHYFPRFRSHCSEKAATATWSLVCLQKATLPPTWYGRHTDQPCQNCGFETNEYFAHSIVVQFNSGAGWCQTSFNQEGKQTMMPEHCSLLPRSELLRS